MLILTGGKKAFQDEYVITKCKLGSGAYGKVHMAYNKESGQQFACKIVDLRALRDRAAQEIEEQKSKYFRNKWRESMAKSSSHDKITGACAVRGVDEYISKKIQDKLDVYHREARVLESISHVSRLKRSILADILTANSRISSAWKK